MDKQIRVAHIIGKWLGGGVESVVMNYYRNIDRDKVQFDFICDDDSTKIPYEEIESLGGKVILIPPYQKVFKYHKRLKQVLKDGNYKIVHSHINTLSVFSLYAAKCAKVPIRIAHSHSTTNKVEKKKNIIKVILRPFVKLFANEYMCCSELAGRWLFGNKKYDSGKVYLLNNAIDLNKFKYDENARKSIRSELDIQDNTLVVGHAGRFVEQKNHSYLIDIFNEIHKFNDNTKLLLLGDGPLLSKMKDKVHSLSLDENVVFLGSRQDAYRYYSAMDIFVFPSLYEGLGLVGVEAQATGLYCLVANNLPNEVAVTNNIKFLSITAEPKNWASIALEKLNDNNIDRINAYKNIVDTKFNIENEACKLVKYYNNFIEILDNKM